MICQDGVKMNKYIIVADGSILKTYNSFKDALKDADFFSLMYDEVLIYRLILRNGESVK